MTWTYGITTCPARLETTLPQTISSLATAGFPLPRLFVDGLQEHSQYLKPFQHLEMTCHFPKVNVAGNWILALWELYIRCPNSDRFAVFQDDIIACQNLRLYLERCKYPEKGYLNLYTCPSNSEMIQLQRLGIGWHESNQLGRGAVALVFSRAAVVKLLMAEHLVAKPQDPHRGWRSIDGGIADSFRNAGWKEYVHNPSLVQHVGQASTYDKRKKNFTKDGPFPTHIWPNRWQSPLFRGEDFDVLELLQK